MPNTSLYHGAEHWRLQIVGQAWQVFEIEPLGPAAPAQVPHR
jgi:hypothetical protein